MSSYQIATDCLHAGYRPGNGEPRNFPIVQSTTFRYETSQDMGALFDLEASGYFYTRLQNPTNDTVAAKICALEGGTAAMLLSSGQAANFYAVFNIAGCGDHVNLRLWTRTARRRSSTPRSGPTPRPCSGRPSPIRPWPCWTLKNLPKPPTPTESP